MNTGNSKITGHHSHSHGVVKFVPDLDIIKTIEADTLLRTDNLMTRQSFQGRFKKASTGDRKGHSGLRPEQMAANMENVERDVITETLLEAAAAEGVVVETETKQPEDFVVPDDTEVANENSI